MKTLHKVVLALVSSFANGISNPAPQGNRALEKIDALTPGYSPRPKPETRNPEIPQKRPLLQKVKEAWMNPKETAATIGVGITYGIVIGALLLLPFPPKSIQAQSTSQPLPLPAVPVVYEVHVTGVISTGGNINQTVRGYFDISIVTDNQQWTRYKYCWSGIYKEEGSPPYYGDATGPFHFRYYDWVNHWLDRYWWENDDSSYSCRIVPHGDGRHLRDPSSPEVYADVEFYLEWYFGGTTINPAAIVTDTDGNRYRVPVFVNGVSYTTWYPGW